MVKVEKIQKWLDKITELNCDGIRCEDCPLHTIHSMKIEINNYKCDHNDERHCIANLISDIKGADRNP